MSICLFGRPNKLSISLLEWPLKIVNKFIRVAFKDCQYVYSGILIELSINLLEQPLKIVNKFIRVAFKDCQYVYSGSLIELSINLLE